MIGTAFLFPHFCAGCHRPGVVLCHACLRKQKSYEPQQCLVCRKPSYLGITHERCRHKTPLCGAYSFFRYQQPFINALKNAKYRHSRQVFQYLLESISLQKLFEVWELKKICPNALVVAIPQSNTTHNERGFNQAEMVGRFLGQLLSIPCNNLLMKHIDTKHQSTIPDAIRLTNLKGSYLLTKHKSPAGDNFIIADDVITTGATVQEAAWTVRSKYPESLIYAVSLFRSR